MTTIVKKVVQTSTKVDKVVVNNNSTLVDKVIINQ